MARKFKVFRTPAGFYDASVAAPSRKAALAAWGSHAGLFARRGGEGHRPAQGEAARAKAGGGGTRAAQDGEEGRRPRRTALDAASLLGVGACILVEIDDAGDAHLIFDVVNRNRGFDITHALDEAQA